jgi:dipeptidyl aminopeptidase/acylaminoacyl peptidase
MLLRLTSDPKPDVSPAWSPDGRTIAFLRLNSDGGVMGLFLLSVETGENYLDHGQGRELTRIPSDRFNWVPSPDGTELAIFLSQHGIRFLSLDTGVARDVSIDDWPLSNGDWSADGKSLFVPSFTSRATPVILDVNEAGKAVVVLEGDANTGFWWMIQSPDGRHGMLEADVPGDNNAWMIENF